MIVEWQACGDELVRQLAEHHDRPFLAVSEEALVSTEGGSWRGVHQAVPTTNQTIELFRRAPEAHND